MHINFSQISTLISFELERAFLRTQSIVYLAAFTLLWYLIIRYAVLNIADLQAPDADPMTWGGGVLNSYFHIALYVFCLMSLLVCANQTSADRVRGTLRFLTLRCSRTSIYTARFLAQVCILSVLIAVCTVAVLLVVVFNTGFSFQLLQQAGLYGLVLIIAVTPFIALMAALSVLIDSARKVSVAAALIWALAASFISGVSHYFPFLSVLEYLVPGSQFEVLLMDKGVNMLMLSYIPMLQALVLFSAGLFFMKRKAL